MWRWGGVLLSFGSFGCCVMLEERHSMSIRVIDFFTTLLPLFCFLMLYRFLLFSLPACVPTRLWVQKHAILVVTSLFFFHLSACPAPLLL
jgi:hypothetical protein